MKIEKIVSGGQTGADRAAFDFALAQNICIGGFVPKDRRAEDGQISEFYPNLIETDKRDYSERTKLNVINSDVTIILSHGNLIGGSLLTKKLAEKHEKPFLHIDFLKSNLKQHSLTTKKLLKHNKCKVLNIAGPRVSDDPNIYQKTKEFLTLLFD